MLKGFGTRRRKPSRGSLPPRRQQPQGIHLLNKNKKVEEFVKIVEQLLTLKT